METEREISMAMDVEILMSKLSLLEKAINNDTAIDSSLEDNGSVTTSTILSSVPDFNDRSTEFETFDLPALSYRWTKTFPKTSTKASENFSKPP